MNVLPTSGPFVRVSVNGAGMGSTAVAASGSKPTLHLHVETPSWFGVSRFEVYANGLIVYAQDIDVPASQIVDFNGDVTLEAVTEDTWVTVAVMGLDEDDFMAPVYTTIALGDLGLDKITSLAFANLGALAAVIGSEQPLPDYFPSIPYAMTNPVFLDVDGGGYKAKYGPPPFCPHDCTPGDKKAEDAFYPWAEGCIEPADPADPKTGEVCYPNDVVGRSGKGGTCGRPIAGECGLGFLAEREAQASPIIGALTVEHSAPGLPAPARPAVNTGEDEATERTRAHAVGRYIWNAFVHGFHVHHDRK